MKTKIAKKSTLAVSAIRHGTVIDHIPKGQAFTIIQLLKLCEHQKSVTLGLNLPSGSMSTKDIIKVEGREISPDEANQIALFSPNATINIIQEYEVVQKYKVCLPDSITQLIRCPNPQCITNHETMASCFIVKNQMDNVFLHCKFCRKSYSQQNIKEFIFNKISPFYH